MTYETYINGVLVENPPEEYLYTPPTAEELAAWLEDIKGALIARFDKPNSIDKLMLKIAFLQENRIRVLEGKQPITAQQFKDWVRGEID